MDNYYPIEIKICSKNGWFTPAEAKNYYGRYSREGITVHWWGDGTGASNHDNIVNYIAGGASRGEKSVNCVLSDNKITLMVNPDDVAWCSQSGNPTTISVETQPTLGDEGYKKWGWLVWQLEGRYGHSLTLYPHNHWFSSTQCPGTIDINRIRAEANKWASGGYNPKPTPAPTPTPTPPAQISLQITDIPNKHVKLVRDANLWDLHFAKWADAKAVKSFPAGTDIEVSAIAKHPLGGEYYLSEYSFSKGIGNGINVKDCEDVVAAPPVVVTPPTVDPPVVTPAPVPDPTPVEVPIPVLSEKDKQQDAEISGIKALLQKIVDFLSSIFSGFSK